MAQLSEQEQQEVSQIEQIIEQAFNDVQQIDQELNQLNIQIDEIENNHQEQGPRVRLSPRNGNEMRLCNHTFQRGPRAGQQCPNVVCINSNTLCRTHHNAEQRRERRRRDREEQQIPLPNIHNIVGRPRRIPPRQIVNPEEQQEVLDLPNIPLLFRAEPAPRPRRPNHRGRNRRQRRVLPDFVLESVANQNVPIFEEEKELIYESCQICQSKVDGAKVVLDCGCEYHLNCYLIIQNEEKCIKCGDKINKTEEDYPDCSICLEKIKTGKIKTKCNHTFHRDCINSWIRMGRGNCDKCPNCRGAIH